jgi:Tfp pilus assembly protein PilF
MYEGSKSKVQLCTEIKDQLEKAIAINPRDDVAYSILGTFYMNLGNVSWIERQLARMFLGRLPDGGYDEAEAALLKAIALAPDVIRHHYELATLYRLRDRTAEARVEYEKTVSLQPVLASDPRRQKNAQHWLETMEKED